MTETPPTHSPERQAVARQVGEARRDLALMYAERRRQVDCWRFQLALLRRIAEAGSATTDDAAVDLLATNKKGDANWKGAAVRRLATEGVIRKDGFEKCQRAARHGSPIVRWVAGSLEMLKRRITELEKLLAAFDATGRGSANG